MVLSEFLHKQVSQLLGNFCRERVPCERFQGLRLGFSIRDNHVTLYEERCDPMDNQEWLRTPIARFTYNDQLNQWVLFSIDRQLRWHIYQNVGPSLNLARLIQALDDDPTGVFWN